MRNWDGCDLSGSQQILTLKLFILIAGLLFLNPIGYQKIFQ